MAKHLLIVESPAKAKTIGKILGKDFMIKSSFGHVRNLHKNKSARKAIDVNNNYRPDYIIPPEKEKVVSDLKKWVGKVDEVWLATDEDREGEAISWHLAQVLNLDVKTTKRIVFREITRLALTKAIEQPRKIDMDVVNAQQARRILDRLIGFELSPLLWKKIKNDLSAGRVQSVAVKLVIERERAIQNFKVKAAFKVEALFRVKNRKGVLIDLKARLDSTSFPTVEETEQFLKNCIGSTYRVVKTSVKPAYRSPAAPFTTSTLQQEASWRLGFPVSRTMRVAQRLYEAGWITYMRTDSTSLSSVALNHIAQVVKQRFGAPYHKRRQYENKKVHVQEAHEAIRPSYVDKMNAGMTQEEQNLYKLIWRRTIASQMAEAQLEKTRVDIEISKQSQYTLVAEGQVLKFDGFLKIYSEATRTSQRKEDKILPPLRVAQVLELKTMTATERFTQPLPHYTEASLVRKMEELGIGRPSTYAPIIAKIMNPKRGYVAKGDRAGKDRNYQVLRLDNKTSTIQAITKTEKVGAEHNKLFASDMGRLVTDFLSQHFENIMNYGFTAEIEHQLDAIARGKGQWVQTVDKIYKPFHRRVKQILEKAQRVNGIRILGKHPQSQLTVLVRMGRYSPVAQIGTAEELGETAEPQYSGLRKDQSIETITLEDCLELFQFPKPLGTYKEVAVQVNRGHFGFYIKYGSLNVSIPKSEDPQQLGLERAIVLIEKYQDQTTPIGYYEKLPITKGTGRFGSFVKWNKLYASISKASGFHLETLTEEQAIVLIKEKQEKEARRYIHNWKSDKISVQNGRWGPFIRVLVGRKKEDYKLLDENDKRMTPEAAKELTLKQVKAIIVERGGTIQKPRKTKAKPKKTKPKNKKKGRTKGG